MNKRNIPPLSYSPNLSFPLSRLKGIGPVKADALAGKGLVTILDLLYYMPIRYEDRTKIVPLNSLLKDEPAFVRAKVVHSGEERFYATGRKL